MSLDRLLESVKGASKSIIEDDGQELTMLMLVETPGKVHVIGGWSKVSKDAFAIMATLTLQGLGATGYVFVSEAWAARFAKDSPLVDRIFGGEIRVMDLPPDDREEIVQIMGCERNGKPFLVHAIIENTPQGRRLREFVKEEWERLEGRMVVTEW